ncbi:MAG: hypothetical protein V1834_02420 [Candidatus Micrarchaeota archaeon]
MSLKSRWVNARKWQKAIIVLLVVVIAILVFLQLRFHTLSFTAIYWSIAYANMHCEPCGICELSCTGGCCCGPSTECGNETCNSVSDCGKTPFCEHELGLFFNGSVCTEYKYSCDGQCSVQVAGNYSSADSDDFFYKCDYDSSKCQRVDRCTCSTDQDCDNVMKTGYCLNGFCEFGMSSPPC